MVRRNIRLLLGAELLILCTNAISYHFFINLQIAALSSFLVIAGSLYAYRKMVVARVEANDMLDEPDLLDAIEDPHGFYEDTDINHAPFEELDLKSIVKEEKKKIKILNLQSVKEGSSAGFSLYRLLPYLFLILGFIALQNNKLLNIAIYLPALLLGIVLAHLAFQP